MHQVLFRFMMKEKVTARAMIENTFDAISMVHPL